MSNIIMQLIAMIDTAPITQQQLEVINSIFAYSIGVSDWVIHYQYNVVCWMANNGVGNGDWKQYLSKHEGL